MLKSNEEKAREIVGQFYEVAVDSGLMVMLPFLEQEILRIALNKNGVNISAAAAALNIRRTTCSMKIKKYGLKESAQVKRP